MVFYTNMHLGRGGFALNIGTMHTLTLMILSHSNDDESAKCINVVVIEKIYFIAPSPTA